MARHGASATTAPLSSRGSAVHKMDVGGGQVKQPSRFGRSVALSTCPASDFGAFSPPELIFQADELDWENARARRAQLLADPRFYKPVRHLANPDETNRHVGTVIQCHSQ